MKPEQQRIAIAEACGWKIENYGPAGYKTLYWRLRRPNGTIRVEDCTGEEWSRAIFGLMTPDYLNDLNAMHEAEKALSEKQQVWYLQKLMQVRFRTHADSGMIACMADKLAFATASQRAEAFLRTIGKWKD